jgi:hypothetical protein
MTRVLRSTVLGRRRVTTVLPSSSRNQSSGSARKFNRLALRPEADTYLPAVSTAGPGYRKGLPAQRATQPRTAELRSMCRPPALSALVAFDSAAPTTPAVHVSASGLKKSPMPGLVATSSPWRVAPAASLLLAQSLRSFAFAIAVQVEWHPGRASQVRPPVDRL